MTFSTDYLRRHVLGASTERVSFGVICFEPRFNEPKVCEVCMPLLVQ
jgi:hypothetical protein